MFSAKKLGDRLASAIEGRAAILEAGKLQLSTDEKDNRIMLKTSAFVLRQVADSIRQVTGAEE